MGFFDILGAFVPLIVIVALLYGVLLFVRKYGYNLKGKDYSPVDIKVISTKMIMPKRFVSVIKVEDKLLVLGVSEHSINLIKELDAVESYVPSETAPAKDSFLDLMKKNFGMK